MVQMPTGTGKTILLAEVLRELKNERIRELKSSFGGVLIVAHRMELIQQICQTLDAFEIKNGKVIENNEPGGDEIPVVVESIQKLAIHIDEVSMEPTLVVIDEAHHALAKTYRMLWERWPKARFLGLTATPCRLDGTAFTDLFDVLLQSKDIQWFIREGWLSDFEYVSVQPDSEEMQKVKGLRKRGVDGDYQTKEMATVLDVPESIRHLYNTYNIYARGKKGIVYAIDRAHAQHIAEYYAAKGVRACWIEARTPAKERERLVREYREGRMDVIVNVDIFSEGFDCPEVEFIQLARPTLSLSKYLQQVGRGMRVTPGRPYVTILDQVGLYQTFGLPTDNRDWNRMFHGRMAGKGEADGGERPLIIRDEVEDKGLVNMDMLHIKRFNEKRTRIEVFLQHGCFGIMRLGHVTCAPQFRRVQRLRHSKYYALAQYDGVGSNATTVIDSEGQNMGLTLHGEVSIDGDIFIVRNQNGRCHYYDAISHIYYDGYPQFTKLAGMEVQKMGGDYYLRDRQNALIIYLSKNGTHYNEHIVVSENVLINKEEGNRQSRVHGFLDDCVLVAADKGIGYQMVAADGRRGECFAIKPKGVTVVPDWERLGMRSLAVELRNEMQQEAERQMLADYHDFMKAMVKRDQVWQEDHLDGAFQVSHCGHTASRPDFICAENVYFHKIETLSVNLDIDGNKVLFTGQIRVEYLLQTSRRIGKQVYDFRLRMGKNAKGVWRFTRAWFGKGKKEK